jgi:hypothetical protein
MMSECFGKEWGEIQDCPALHWDEIVHYYCKYRQFASIAEDEDLPDTCPYAPILKLLAEATDIDNLKVEQHVPQSYGDPVSDKWSVVTFWIRR